MQSHELAEQLLSLPNATIAAGDLQGALLIQEVEHIHIGTYQSSDGTPKDVMILELAEEALNEDNELVFYCDEDRTERFPPEIGGIEDEDHTERFPGD